MQLLDRRAGGGGGGESVIYTACLQMVISNETWITAAKYFLKPGDVMTV